MRTNKILLGGLAGGVTFFFLGWLIYGILLMDYSMSSYNQCAARPMESMVWWAMILSNLTFGLLVAIVLNWSNSLGVLSGAKIGGVLGLLIAISMDFSVYSMTTTFLQLSAVFVDIIVYTVMSTIVGAVVGLVMDLGKKAD